MGWNQYNGVTAEIRNPPKKLSATLTECWADITDFATTEVLATRYKIKCRCHDDDVNKNKLQWEYTFMDRVSGKRLKYSGCDSVNKVTVREGGTLYVRARYWGSVVDESTWSEYLTVTPKGLAPHYRNF